MREKIPSLLPRSSTARIWRNQIFYFNFGLFFISASNSICDLEYDVCSKSRLPTSWSSIYEEPPLTGIKNRGNGAFRFRVGCTARVRIPSSSSSPFPVAFGPLNSSFNAMRTLCEGGGRGRRTRGQCHVFIFEIGPSGTTSEMANLSLRAKQEAKDVASGACIWHSRRYTDDDPSALKLCLGML